MDSTESGMETDSREEHPKNAPPPMDVTAYSTPPNSTDPGISRSDPSSSPSYPATETCAGSRDATPYTRAPTANSTPAASLTNLPSERTYVNPLMSEASSRRFSPS